MNLMANVKNYLKQSKLNCKYINLEEYVNICIIDFYI